MTVSRVTLDRLAARTEWALLRWGGLMDSSRRGIARDGHGDLRLDHVYWFPDRRPPGDWIAVDCIEFDDRFRCADPIADIAFLAMELASRVARSRRLVCEGCLRASADEDGRAASCPSIGPTAPPSAARSRASSRQSPKSPSRAECRRYAPHSLAFCSL